MINWSKSLYCETKEFWQQIRNQCNYGEKGFAIFYSPIRINPKLMIIGLNPGGNENDFNEEHACDIPNKHNYFEFQNTKDDYDLAIIMRDLFKKIDLLEDLKNSVKLNLIFFRSSNEKELKSTEILNKMISFCENKVIEIIEKIKPQIILTEGISVFDRICKLLNGKDIKILINDNHGRVLLEGNIGNSLILGMIHPSGQFTKSRFHKNMTEIGREIKFRLTRKGLKVLKDYVDSLMI